MKIYLILGLLCMGVNGEKKINLDDIERDNLKAEGISKSGITQPEGSKYLAKPVIDQQQYQIPNQYRGPPPPPPPSASVTYVTPPPVQNYPTETFVQPGKYARKEQIYQQQNNYQEQTLPERYYNEYQQQPLLFPKRIAPNVYESQQLAYQPEVNVGNQLPVSSVQQKVVSTKFAKNVNKDQEYINIPMMHLFTYYPNLDVNSGKTNGLFVPQLATTATNHISIPVYTSTLSQRPVVSARPTYEIQYTPKQNNAVSNKVTKGAVYTAPVNPKKFSGSPILSVPTDAPADQTYAQGRQFLYTQAYIAPSQPQYVSQLIYAQPTAVYMQATPVYSDVYVHPSNYDQDNSLQGSSRYTTPVEQLQSTVAIADELPNQGLGQQSSQTQSVTQNYIKGEPDEPNTDLVPPQIPPQDFKSDTASVSSQDEELLPEQNHVTSSEPRSLLDSYVPSNVIAAQDSSRYRERPIKLERGFLPSKENFLYKKRKVE